MLARPGAIIFGPPEKPAKKMGFDEPERDANVLLEKPPVHPSDDVAAGDRAHRLVGGPVESVVLDDGDAAACLRPRHGVELLIGAAAMRSRGDEDGDLGSGNLACRPPGRCRDDPRPRPPIGVYIM
jgi:hypothetical protein